MDRQSTSPVDQPSAVTPPADDPWAWMQPHDVRMMGDSIMDPAERQRWCLAVLLGGLPYMWRIKAAAVREMIYAKLALRPGDKVLILGESVESCGFEADIRKRVGPGGEIQVIDVIEEARRAVMGNKRGRRGQRGTWRYDYVSHIADGYFDCVAVLQGVQHSDDWREAGTELLRVMKPQRSIVLAEITFNQQLELITQVDLHLEYWIEKMLAGVPGIAMKDVGYFSGADLLQAFDGLVMDPGAFNWRGLEVFWGSKPGVSA